MAAGVLNQKQVRDILVRSTPPRIKATNQIDLSLIDPSAIDLPLGERYFEMRASCRPGKNSVVKDIIQHYKSGNARSLDEGTIFEREKIYLVELPWSVELPLAICARATAKSSVGRLDALVRLIADHESEFETVSLGSTASLWLEIRPNTFDLKVSPGQSLSQLRFLHGEEHHCTVSPEALKFEDDDPLVLKDGAELKITSGVGDRDSVLLQLDLDNDPRLGFVGFKAKEPEEMPEPIDPSRKEPREGEQDLRYNPTGYWDPVYCEDERKCVLIEPNRFYIFRSKERFRLPAHLAVDCRAVSESLGDIRIHYAGFAHPFFGYERKEGAPLIFEVRGYQIPTLLQDNTALAKVFFRRMAEPAEPVMAASYSDQELTLSKCFAPWPTPV